jgi:CheY-like chemotaxis protein
MANILHVEDEDAWIRLIRDQLIGHRVDSARSQSEALRLLVNTKEPYDVALVDLSLGDDDDRSGGEVLDVLRLAHPSVRRIVVTARAPQGGLIRELVVRFEAEEVLLKGDFKVMGLRRVVDDVDSRRGRGETPAANERTVFIGYGHEGDRSYVRSLATHLDQAGLATWYDEQAISGDRWTNVVKKRIDASAAVVVVMTPEAERSHWLLRQLSRATEMEKPILPLLLSGELFRSLSGYDCEVVTGGRLPGQTFLHRLRRLVGADEVALENRFSGPMELAFVRRLGDSWRELTIVLEIPAYEQAPWPTGREPGAIWTWLKARGRLHDLPKALVSIDRTDLAGLFDDGNTHR